MRSRNGFRRGRVVAAVLLAELLPVLLLVALVFAYGVLNRGHPGTVSPTQFAQGAGAWVGPLGGSTATLLLAGWAGRGVPAVALRQGVLIGCFVAALDLFILVLGGQPLVPLVWLSNGLKVAAGAVGGLLAARRPRV